MQSSSRTPEAWPLTDALDGGTLHRLIGYVLEQFDQKHVLLCEERRVRCALTAEAAELLCSIGVRPEAGEPLPRAIDEAIDRYLEERPRYATRRRVPPQRVLVSPRRGRKVVVYVSAMRIAGVPGIGYMLRLDRAFSDTEFLVAELERRVGLRPGERKLLRLVIEMRSNEQIAATMKLKPSTVRLYLHQLYSKLDVHSREEIIALFERMRRGC